MPAPHAPPGRVPCVEPDYFSGISCRNVTPKHPVKESLAERILRTTGVDITLCPHCGKGHLRKTNKIIPRGQSP